MKTCRKTKCLRGIVEAGGQEGAGGCYLHPHIPQQLPPLHYSDLPLSSIVYILSY